MPAFHVSQYVCQTQMEGLWPSRGRGGRGGCKGQRLIVHKSSRSIVSGGPPVARADVVPMDRSVPGPSTPLPQLPVGPSGWEASSRARLLLAPPT